MAMFLVMAVLALALVPLVTEAQIPPALYRCTVYDNNVLVGAGRTVEAYVGTETTPRASGTTGANSVCILQVSVTMDEITQSEALSFTVDGVDATETPDVDVTLEAPDVRLDITNGAPTPPPTPPPTPIPCHIWAPDEVYKGTSGHTASGIGGMDTYSWSISGGTIDSATDQESISWSAGIGSTATLYLTVTYDDVSANCQNMSM